MQTALPEMSTLSSSQGYWPTSVYRQPLIFLHVVTAGRYNWQCPSPSFSIILLFLQIAVYLGKRDFVDHVSHTDPVGTVCMLCEG